MRQAAMDYVLDTPPREVLRKAITVYRQAQETLCAIEGQLEQPDLLTLRAGTVLVLSVIEHLGNPFAPKQLTQKDWKEIAQAISGETVLGDGPEYSLYVFQQYAKYIDISCDLVAIKLSSQYVSEIRELANDLRDKAEELKSGKITEPDYVESCLWISLDAMVKLLSATLTSITGEDAQALLMAVTQLAFEYGRFQLYAEKNAEIAGFLEGQATLDQSLNAQYAAVQEEVRAKADQFLDFVHTAFAPDAMERLMGSVNLARAAGVPEQEILKSTADVDAFFM